jgi:hypothetical protein
MKGRQFRVTHNIHYNLSVEVFLWWEDFLQTLAFSNFSSGPSGLTVP